MHVGYAYHKHEASACLCRLKLQSRQARLIQRNSTIDYRFFECSFFIDKLLVVQFYIMKSSSLFNLLAT